MKHFKLSFLIMLALTFSSQMSYSTSVVDIVVNSEDHTTLETALTEANLVDDLQGSGPFTVFAPTDEAFEALPDGLLETVLNDWTGTLHDLLLYHVLAGTVMSTDLSDGMFVEMNNDKKVQVRITSDGVFINNAKVTVADIEADNGVVHVIDAVLLPSPDVQLKETAEYGSVLTDTYGNTLYFFTRDADGTSMCTDGCLNNWPVFYSENPETGEGLEASDFGTIERTDGSMQATYKGWPLYYFVNDSVPGEMNGEGIINKWFVAKPDYTIMLIDDQLTGNDGVDYKGDYTPGSEMIQYFTDDEGATLYTWKNDKYKKNNFTDPDFNKNSIWPIYEEEDIVVPSILDPADFDVINVFGRKQMTYKGWPLYYFGQDMMIRSENKGVSVPAPGIWPVAVQGMMMAPKYNSVAEIVIESEDHTTLEAAVVAAGLAEPLQGEGQFTVFAPTDAAFAALPEGTLDALLDDPSGQLTDILLHHVVEGKAMSSDLSDGQMIETVFGQNLTVTITSEGVFINEVQVTVADIEAANGVVHVIDAVLLPTTKTVADIVVESEDHTTLEAAVVAAGLAETLQGEGPFTVFAPTNAAFASLLEELGATSLADIDSATLEAVLKMHVVSGKVMSNDLSEGLTATTALGQEIIFSLDGGASVTDPNGRVSNITAVDIEAQNGVVHVIDTVILPEMLPSTVVDIATSDDNFSSLVAALTRSDLSVDFVDLLSGEGPFTVFAPTNAAFASLLEELGATSLADIDSATLEAVLKMHVVSGKVMSTDLSEGLTATTALGQEIMFSLDGGASITDPNNRMSNITAVDIEAVNGVVHVIDKVILPDLTATGIEDYSEISMEFYPNPARDFITVRTEDLGSVLRIIDISGKVMKMEEITQPSQQVNVSDMQSGMYFISLENGQSLITKKMIVR